MKSRKQRSLLDKYGTIIVSLLIFQLFVVSPESTANEQLNNDNVAGDANSDPALRPEILPPPEKKLPDAVDQVPGPGTTVPPQDGPVLKGSANATNLSATAQLMTSNPLSRYRGDKLLFYRISIKNSGATPVVILGKDAQMATEATAAKTVRASLLEKHDNTLLTPKEKALVAAVGIGSAGLASSIFYEHMTPTEHRKRSLGIALGRDRGRHEVESENLGTRFLMPGDETLGWVAFEDSEIMRSKNVVDVPVMFPPYSTIAATLKIPVVGATSQPAEPVIDKSQPKNQ